MKKRILPFTMLMILAFSIPLSAQWEPTVTNQFPTNHRVWDMQYVDAQTIWAFSSYDAFPPPAAQLPVVHRSTDGGKTWVSHSIAGQGGIQARDISAIDSLTAYVALPNSGLYRTQNGGADWEEITVSSVFSTFFFVYFYNENEGWVFGRKPNQHPVSATTTDGGITWSVIDEANMPSYLSNEYYGNGYATNASYDVVDDVVVINTSLGYYWKSTDKAQSWERISNPVSDLGLWIAGIVMKDESTIMLVTGGNASTVLPTATYTTTDGGATWNSGSPGVTPGTVCYVPGTDGTFVICGHNNFIAANKFGTALSYDFGQTWHYIDDTRLISMEFLDDETGIAALGKIVPWGSQGEVYKWNGGSLRLPIYVNDDATGANNGTTWNDAFPDLQDALAIANDGDQIWVAEGLYLPGDDPTATFLIDKNIHLYGGFAGTEATLAERGDPAEHPAVLSGDLNGDDVDDDFVNFKADNLMTVVTVGDNVTEKAVIDGFTIRNGQADGTITNQELRGGGLYTRASVEVRNCLFTQNFAGLSGGGAYFYASSLSDGITVEVNNCKFEKNRSDGNGGGIMLDAYGQNSSFIIVSCEFSGNRAQFNGGGINAFTRENSGNANITVEGCSFTKNSTVEYNGSGIHAVFYGTNSNIVLNNSTFHENETALFGTATLWGAGQVASGNVDVSNCQFEQNTATYVSGLGVGSLADVAYSTYTVTGCNFVNNHASDLGGAMEVYGESPSLITVDDCMFTGNSAGNKGGAMIVTTNHPDFEAVIKNCIFENNNSPTGAAVDASNFTENPGMTQDADVTFENCLMTGNVGQEGTVSLSNFGTLKLLNCTVASNESGSVKLGNQSSLEFQNSIFYNPGFSEFIAGEGDFASLGGNLLGDLSLDGFLNASDQQNLDPLFVAPDDFHLSMSSPCINRGINDGVTASFDLDGNDRIQHDIVDIGAYESPFVTSAREVIAGEVGLSPNPATDFLYLQLPESITQPVEVSLYNASGKMLKSQTLAKGQPLELDGLAAGMYLVKAVADERVYTGKFSKF